MRTDKFDLSIFDIYVRHSVFVRLDIAKITSHSLFIIRRAMISAERIEDTSGANKSISEITKNMDVDAMLARSKAAQDSFDGSWCIFLSLMKY